MTPLHYLLFAAMLATLGVLIVGVTGFLRGGAFNEKDGNKLMRCIKPTPTSKATTEVDTCVNGCGWSETEGAYSCNPTAGAAPAARGSNRKPSQAAASTRRLRPLPAGRHA